MGDSGLDALLSKMKNKEARQKEGARQRMEAARRAMESDDSSDGARYWGRGAKVGSSSGAGPRPSGESRMLDSLLNKAGGRKTRRDDSSDEAPAKRRAGGGGFWEGTGICGEGSDSDGADNWGKMGGFKKPSPWEENKKRKAMGRRREEDDEASALLRKEERALAEQKLRELERRATAQKGGGGGAPAAGGGGGMVANAIDKEAEEVQASESAWINNLFSGLDARAVKASKEAKKARKAAKAAAAAAAGGTAPPPAGGAPAPAAAAAPRAPRPATPPKPTQPPKTVEERRAERDKLAADKVAKAQKHEAMVKMQQIAAVEAQKQAAFQKQDFDQCKRLQRRIDEMRREIPAGGAAGSEPQSPAPSSPAPAPGSPVPPAGGSFAESKRKKVDPAVVLQRATRRAAVAAVGAIVAGIVAAQFAAPPAPPPKAGADSEDDGDMCDAAGDNEA
eukprot:TRINITY_DN9195_c0_g2_i1.p1 TRINITY_DN9195_c0_g2~~TRINITY_DN9195_c0_g2_i1.p1  ORF type:complete len:474 (+),score=161.66 TRINITY_DN9195_c0_g2_i1:77-1423(+)